MRWRVLLQELVPCLRPGNDARVASRIPRLHDGVHALVVVDLGDGLVGRPNRAFNGDRSANERHGPEDRPEGLDRVDGPLAEEGHEEEIWCTAVQDGLLPEGPPHAVLSERAVVERGPSGEDDEFFGDRAWEGLEECAAGVERPVLRGTVAGAPVGCECGDDGFYLGESERTRPGEVAEVVGGRLREGGEHARSGFGPAGGQVPVDGQFFGQGLELALGRQASLVRWRWWLSDVVVLSVRAVTLAERDGETVVLDVGLGDGVRAVVLVQRDGQAETRGRGACHFLDLVKTCGKIGRRERRHGDARSQ